MVILNILVFNYLSIIRIYVQFAIILMVNYKDILSAPYDLYGFVLMRIGSWIDPNLRKGFQNIYFLFIYTKAYSFSIEFRERKLSNEHNLCQEIELKNLFFNCWIFDIFNI